MKKVLAKKELKALLKVKTTVEEAKQIKQRNLKLLDALYAGYEYTGYVGCPHCHGSCKTCEWYKYPVKITSSHDPKCFEASFGGVTYGELSAYGIRYFFNSEQLRSINEIEPEFQDKIERFLLGHIEWANEIIKRGTKKRKK